MRLCFNHLLYAFSDALDYVERDYFKTISFHGKRIAYFCSLLGEYFELNDEDLSCLVGCAILHDNGLTEYYKYGDKVTDLEFLKIHCVVGEDNISFLPFYDKVKDVIKYHHETADGSGPFSMTKENTPFYAQLIHICDWADVEYELENISEEDYYQMIAEMNNQRDIQYDSVLVDAFQKIITYDVVKRSSRDVDRLLRESSHNIYKDFNSSEMLSICHLFARIIDSKSPHTSSHSVGVASRAARMGMHYQYPKEMISKLFFVGAMHDVGKLVIDRDVLEKPAQLTDQEFTYIQTHAYYTYTILSNMDLGDMTHWASYHHEKLDGTGYPFGKKGEELDFIDRLLACCDIYQALTEDRPYKNAIGHDKTIQIMRDMAAHNKIDEKIVNDMDIVFGEIVTE